MRPYALFPPAEGIQLPGLPSIDLKDHLPFSFSRTARVVIEIWL